MSAGFPNQPPVYPTVMPPPRKSSGFRWLIGLVLVGLGMLFIGGIVCVAGLWYVASNLDRWVVALGREAIVAAINEAEIPQSEKAEIVTQVDRVVTAYQQRKINQADLERVFSELQQSPAMTALALSSLPDEYLTDTGLSADEVELGQRTFQRALRGVYEGKISDEDLYRVLPGDLAGDPSDDDAGGQSKMNNQLRLASTNARSASADDDLRQSLIKLKVMADNARIPDEPFELDISDEVKKLVDKALAGK